MCECESTASSPYVYRHHAERVFVHTSFFPLPFSNYSEASKEGKEGKAGTAGGFRVRVQEERAGGAGSQTGHIS